MDRVRCKNFGLFEVFQPNISRKKQEGFVWKTVGGVWKTACIPQFYHLCCPSPEAKVNKREEAEEEEEEGESMMAKKLFFWHKFAAVFGAAGVGLGAYGAHVFKPQNPMYKEVWQTASLYHLVHSAALLSTPSMKHPHIFGALITAGIVTFSGTCYTVAYLEDRKYGYLAPLGGLSFMAGWGSLLF